MRTIGVVTTSRADYGIYRPLLKAIKAHPDLQLHLIVSGMHLSPEFGLTEKEILDDGFTIDERIEMLLSSDSPEGISKSVGMGVIGFSQLFGRFQPDILVVLGDRYEMFAAALAALPFKIPIAHLYGGEVTQGAIDESLRHAMTKLSHIHFTSTAEYKNRVVQLGEASENVIVSGSCSLDNISTTPLFDRSEFADQFGIVLPTEFLLSTFHPVSLEFEQTTYHVQSLLEAFDAAGLPVLLTMANADTSGHLVNQIINAYSAQRDNIWVVKNLGVRGYFSAMSMAKAMVGNSSSGMVEAASFKLPVINIGDRQFGRVFEKNVINVGYSSTEIIAGIHQAISESFRQSLVNLVNPHGDGHAAERIVETLSTISLSGTFTKKPFHDLPTV